ncbi:MAG: hypothetical protein KBS81_09515 [Spirochaetales bacterium]|nr:hypothetical protein [Candidatus Physcosoma equi]
MASLETTYMGLKLKSPIIVASSSLTETVESLKKCEANGAGAVVLKSIFEEQIESEIKKELEANDGFMNFSQAPEEYSKRVEEFYLSKYLTLLKEAKKELSIPVIASIRCKTNENWQNYAERFVATGADAIEINYYPVTSDASVTSSDIDKEFEKFV